MIEKKETPKHMHEITGRTDGHHMELKKIEDGMHKKPKIE